MIQISVPAVNLLIRLKNTAAAQTAVVVAGCDHCGAGPGKQCIGVYGRPTVSMHIARKTASRYFHYRQEPETWEKVYHSYLDELLEKWHLELT